MTNNEPAAKSEFSSKTVLVVDDEKAIVDLLKFNLQREGIGVLCAYDGGEALNLALSENPDLILLDVMLPVADGFTVCNTLREKGFVAPIIMLTAKGEENDKVFGLDNGADDYITKPFSVRELTARVKSNLRRTITVTENTGNRTNKKSIGDIIIDFDRHTIYKGEKELDLTEREYEILCYMSENPGRVISREELMTEVWKYDYFGDLRAVDVAMRRLREKVESHPEKPELIMTKRGAGYFIDIA